MAKSRKTRAQKERLAARRQRSRVHRSENRTVHTDSPSSTKASDSKEVKQPERSPAAVARAQAMRVSLAAFVVLVSLQLILWGLQRAGVFGLGWF